MKLAEALLLRSDQQETRFTQTTNQCKRIGTRWMKPSEDPTSY